MDSPFAAGVMVSDPGGRLLFMKRTDGKGWALPGGKIEAGESPEQAARRETLEETGWTVGDLTQIDVNENGFVTFGAGVAADTVPTLNDEHSEYVWALPADAPQPLHPGVASTLTKMAAMDFDPKEGFRQNSAKLSALKEHNSAAQDRREYDSNNWFVVYDNPLSKVGVYQYSEASIKRGGDRSKSVGVYRPAEELGSEECINSFKLMPWTDDHPADLLGDPEQGYVPTDEKGVHGVIGEDVYFKDGTLYGNLKVFSQALARKIAGGKKELSCGYHCDFVQEDGVFEGTPYQYVQRNMRGNHVASVKSGRMGSEVRVLDSAERFTFALDLKEDVEDCIATEVAGTTDAEKVMTGYPTIGEIVMATKTHAKDAKGDVKDPVKEDDKPSDLASPGAKDAEEKEKMEAAKDDEEEAMDKAEEEKDKEDKSMDAIARMRARDRRSGARDARRSARDSAKSARDAAIQAAKDADKDDKKDDKEDKGMDAAAVTAIVQRELAKGPKAMDAAEVIRTIRKEEAAKLTLYSKISPIVGAFDHSEMSHVDMAAYGLDKLGAPKASDPVMALDYLLAGRAQATQPVRQVRGAQDESGSSFIDSYINSTH